MESRIEDTAVARTAIDQVVAAYGLTDDQTEKIRQSLDSMVMLGVEKLARELSVDARRGARTCIRELVQRRRGLIARRRELSSQLADLTEQGEWSEVSATTADLDTISRDITAVAVELAALRSRLTSITARNPRRARRIVKSPTRRKPRSKSKPKPATH